MKCLGEATLHNTREFIDYAVVVNLFKCLQQILMDCINATVERSY